MHVFFKKQKYHVSVYSVNNPLPLALLLYVNGGRSDGAMVLGKLPVPGRPTIWMIKRQGPIVLAKSADGVLWTFLLSSILSHLFLPLSRRRPDID